MMYRKALVFATQDSSIASASSSAGEGTALGASTRPTVHDESEDELSELPDMILAEKKPRRQKGLARRIRATVAQEQEWEMIKFNVVVQGSYCKFYQNTDLRELLLATGDRELAEASPFDRVWGIGFDEGHAEQSRSQWGSNLLGKALMSVRERLKTEMSEVESPVVE